MVLGFLTPSRTCCWCMLSLLCLPKVMSRPWRAIRRLNYFDLWEKDTTREAPCNDSKFDSPVGTRRLPATWCFHMICHHGGTTPPGRADRGTWRGSPSRNACLVRMVYTKTQLQNQMNSASLHPRHLYNCPLATTRSSIDGWCEAGSAH